MSSPGAGTFRPVSVLALAFALVACALVAQPAAAQTFTFPAADDAWQTPGGGTTFSDFSAVPLPAGFFGPGSQAFAGRIDFVGQPLPTNPAGALQQADTVVRRLGTVTLTVGGAPVSVPIRILGLALRSERPIRVTYSSGGTTWTDRFDVKLTLSPGGQPLGSMTITLQCADGGVFSSQIQVIPRYVFVSQTTGTMYQLDCRTTSACGTVTLTSVGTQWINSYNGFDPVTSCGAHPLPPSVQVDGDCDGVFDFTTLGRHGFVPGFQPGCGGAGPSCRRSINIEEHQEQNEVKHTVVPSQNPSDVTIQCNELYFDCPEEQEPLGPFPSDGGVDADGDGIPDGQQG